MTEFVTQHTKVTLLLTTVFINKDLLNLGEGSSENVGNVVE